MKVYVASSWRNTHQSLVVDALRAIGDEVYDFRNPPKRGRGFHWSDIDENWQLWSPEKYRDSLDHDVAVSGFESDLDAMEWADAFVLVMPCGRSAHLEMGWACGRGKKTIILLDNGEPELMNKLADHICVSLAEVIKALHA